MADFLERAGWMVWVEVATGQAGLGVGRIDVLAVSKSYKTTIKAYEVKASRDDFARDINSGKYLKYQEFCNQFYFASEAGILKKEDIPRSYGLITLGDKGWHVQRAPRRIDCQLTSDFMMSLLMKLYQDHRPNLRSLQHKNIEAYAGLRDAAYRFGKQYARELAEARESIKNAAGLHADIDKALGKKHESISSAVWEMRGEVNHLLGQYRYAPEIAELTHALEDLFSGGGIYYVPGKLRKVAEKLEIKRIGGSGGDSEYEY